MMNWHLPDSNVELQLIYRITDTRTALLSYHLIINVPVRKNEK